MKTKTVYTKRMAYELRLRGHEIKSVEPNPDKPEFNVWIFEDTKSLEDDMSEITKYDKVARYDKLHRYNNKNNIDKEKNMMVTSPNQKVIITGKVACNSSNFFAIINIDAINKAAQNLQSGAFKLWIYFAKNQPGYKFALSNKELKETFGMSKSQYDAAVHALVNAGYLEPIKEGSNIYIFIEDLDKKDELLTKAQKSSKINVNCNQFFMFKDNVIVQ